MHLFILRLLSAMQSVSTLGNLPLRNASICHQYSSDTATEKSGYLSEEALGALAPCTTA